MKFKPGDIVERIKDEYDSMKVGDRATVVRYNNNMSIILKEYSYGHDPDKFKLVKKQKDYYQMY